MIRYGLFLLLGLLLFGCGTSEEEAVTEEGLAVNFHIKGTIKGASLQRVRLEAASPNGAITVGETTTNADGEYNLEGNIPGMGLYSLVVGENAENAIVLPLEVNDKVMINASMDDFAISPKISGTDWAKPLMRYMQLFGSFSDAQAKELPTITDPEKQLKRFEELRKPLLDFVTNQVDKDPGNTANIIFVSMIFPDQNQPIEQWDKSNLVLLKKMEKAYAKEHSDSPFASNLTQQVAQIEAAVANSERMSSGTLAAPEIAMKNPQGKELRLSSLKGKVVLIDFWASWCQPCRRENPNVVRIYKKYRSQGFEVFSVSLDKDPEAWKAAIAKDGLIWPNHVSDLLEWQTPMIQLYGFNAIPYTVLVNREGNIIGVNLRGEQLEQKLKEVISN